MEPPPISGVTLEDTSEYTMIDNYNPATDAVVVDQSNNCFIVAKMAPLKSQKEGGKRQRYWNWIQRELPHALSVKPDASRGKKMVGQTPGMVARGSVRIPYNQG